WNQAVLLDLAQPLDPALLEQTAQQLVTHHDALRLRFSHAATGWQQSNAADETHALVSHIDLSDVPIAEQSAAVNAHATEIQASLDLTNGPLLRVATFDLGPQGSRLLVVVHHLAVDGVSWRILLEDLHTVYQQLQSGAALALPAKTTSFQHWATKLQAFAQSPELRAEADTWLSRPWEQVATLPIDHDTSVEANVESSARIASVTLSADETRALLQDVPQAYNAQINDLLLTALAEAFARWTGERTILVDLEGHGREDLFADANLSRTVGWFTSLFPVVLDVRAASGPDGMIKTVKEQVRQIPRRGIGYGLLRHLSDDSEVRSQLAALPKAEILFNYLGQLDQALPEGAPFTLSREASGPVHSPRNRRTHLLEINGFVANGSLRLDWTYSEQLHDRATIERVAQDCLRALQSLIAYCLTSETRGYTPSDFPLAVVDQPQLDLISRERAIADLYPLASVQQGMLFHTLSAPASGVYVQQLTCDLSGDLDVAAFRRAWQHTVDQHAILRTSFLWEHVDQPLQLVQPQAAIPFTQLDWRDRPASEQEQQFATYLQEDRERGFDLLTPPLLRLALIQTGDTDYRFLWSYHHIVLDGWSMPLIFRQVLTAYHAFRTNREAQIEASRPYRDYIAWLQRQDLNAAESFWRSTLAGFSAPTPLTVDRPFGGESGAERAYGEQTLTLSQATTEALQTLARQHDLTINTLVQGAWALLLNRYSGERDIVFGAATSGRPPELTGSETMIGLFINTLPVRVDTAPEAGLIPWLQQLQAHQVEMRQFEFTPLAQIQSWSSIPRGQSL
ncbi:MAG: non-ribosomal peptide synthetase, partial [Chloroflexi bacterium]|nr:non-ribosomal peptide synthetase [Chloroflexota bacterium]